LTATLCLDNLCPPNEAVERRRMEHQGGHRTEGHHRADLSSFPKTEDDAGPDHGAPSGRSRRALVVGIIVAVFLILIVILHIAGVSPGIHH
jgi:hypothetical protein